MPKRTLRRCGELAGEIVYPHNKSRSITRDCGGNGCPETPPVIVSGQVFNVDEGQPNGTIIGTIAVVGSMSCVDSFTITAGNGDSDYFAISSSGVITVNSAFYQAESQRVISVRASNQYGNSGIVNVTINVNALQPPVITPGQSFNISEVATIGTLVGQLVTTGPATTSFTIGTVQKSVLGPNLYNGTMNVVNSPWVDDGGNKFTIDGSQVSNTNLRYNNQMTIGETYSIRIDVTNYTGAGGIESVEINMGTILTPAIAANGVHWITGVASTDDLIIRARPGFAGTIEIKQFSEHTSEVSLEPVLIDANGDIDVATALDYEQGYSYTLPVTPHAGATAGAAENVVINVLDATVVVSSGQSFTLANGSSAGTTVGTVSTTGDTPTAFTIDDAAFNISSAGVITSTASVTDDTEYTVVVSADDGTTIHNQSVTITVGSVAVPINAMRNDRLMDFHGQTLANHKRTAPNDYVTQLKSSEASPWDVMVGGFTHTNTADQAVIPNDDPANDVEFDWFIKGNGGNAMARWNERLPTNSYTRLEFKSVTETGNPRVFLMINLIDASNYIRVGIGAQGWFEIQQCVAGTISTIGTGQSGLAIDTTHVIEKHKTGDNVDIYVDNQLMQSFTI